MSNTPSDAELESLISQNLLVDSGGQCAFESWADIRPELVKFARAVLEKWGTQPQAGVVPQGWKAVPVNPTPEMWKAAKSVPDPNPPYPPHYGLVWDAMLAASPTPPAEQQAPRAAPGMGNSGFDHQTAADFLNGKTISDEAVRKFVAVSRWAHDERSALSATLLAMHGVLTSREAEIALLKKALLEAETAPQPAPAPLIARSLAEWHEQDGNVAWWAWNGREWAGEPAWIGTPNCEDWPGYHTHWTPHPEQPVCTALAAQGGKDA